MSSTRLYTGTARCPRCDKTIAVHPANYCLDAWVAEVVLGWKWFLCQDGTRFLFSPINDGEDDGETKYAIGNEPYMPEWYEEVWPFSQDYNYSTEIIRHMTKTHWWRILSPFAPNMLWHAVLHPHNITGSQSRTGWYEMGETLSLAVCRTALTAYLEAPRGFTNI